MPYTPARPTTPPAPEDVKHLKAQLPMRCPSRRLFRLKVFILAALLLPAIVQAADPWEEKALREQELRQLQANIAKAKQRVDATGAKQSDAEKKLKAVEQEIQQTLKSIARLEGSIEKGNRQLKQLERQERQQLGALSQQKKLLSKQIRATFTMGQEQGLKLLLSAEDPTQLQRGLQYYQYVNQARGERITEYRVLIDDLKATRKDILIQNQALVGERQALARERDNLLVNKSERQRVLARLNQDLSSQQKKVAHLERSRKDLETLLKEVEKTISNLELTEDSVPFSKLRAKLPWPVAGKLQNTYGKSIAGNRLRSSGVHFQAQANSPVTSVHHGRVVFSDWLRGFGLLLIVDHGDNYMSLYGFNQALLKETGDWVNQGEVIASAGNSGGQIESGLYFEIRHAGKPVNPLKWLSRR